MKQLIELVVMLVVSAIEKKGNDGKLSPSEVLDIVKASAGPLFAVIPAIVGGLKVQQTFANRAALVAAVEGAVSTNGAQLSANTKDAVIDSALAALFSAGVFVKPPQ